MTTETASNYRFPPENELTRQLLEGYSACAGSITDYVKKLSLEMAAQSDCLFSTINTLIDRLTADSLAKDSGEQNFAGQRLPIMHLVSLSYGIVIGLKAGEIDFGRLADWQKDNAAARLVSDITADNQPLAELDAEVLFEKLVQNGTRTVANNTFLQAAGTRLFASITSQTLPPSIVGRLDQETGKELFLAGMGFGYGCMEQAWQYSDDDKPTDEAAKIYYGL